MTKNMEVKLTFQSKNALSVKFSNPELSLSFAKRYISLLKKYNQISEAEKVGAGGGTIPFANYELKSKKFGEIAMVVTPGAMVIATAKIEKEEKLIDFLMAVFNTAPEKKSILDNVAFEIDLQDTEYFQFKPREEYPTLEHYASEAEK